MIFHLPLRLTHPQQVWHETRSSVFLTNLLSTQAWGAAQGAPGQQGGQVAAFVPGRTFFGAVQEPAETFPFLWHFWSPWGRAMPARPCTNWGQSMRMSLRVLGQSRGRAPICLPQVSWLHCAPGTAPSIVCGSRHVALPCLKTRPKHQSHLGASGGFAFDLPDSKRGLRSVFLPFTAEGDVPHWCRVPLADSSFGASNSIAPATRQARRSGSI